MEKVLVTGASGFIAEHCIIELLKNGYSVKGSLRTMGREQEVRDAVKTETDDAKLEFCKLDLLDDDGWEEAMRDCDYLMHVASPFVIEVDLKFILFKVLITEPILPKPAFIKAIFLIIN